MSILIDCVSDHSLLDGKLIQGRQKIARKCSTGMLLAYLLEHSKFFMRSFPFVLCSTFADPYNPALVATCGETGDVSLIFAMASFN